MFETILSIIGLFLTGGGLIYAGLQISQTRNIARGEFLLHLDELFQQHIEVHTRLRPGGKYATGKSKPSSAEEWIAIERYMGLFERIKVLIDSKIVDLDTIDRLYGYRVFNIVANNTIRHIKLEQEASSWRDFIELWHALERKRQKQGAS